MLEGEFSRKLLAALRKHPALAEAVIIRHVNQFQAGVPDFSISIGKHTEFFELKIHPNRPTKLQTYYLKRLGAGGHLVTVDKKLIWAALDGNSYGIAVGQDDSAFDWLVSEIVKLCVNL